MRVAAVDYNVTVFEGWQKLFDERVHGRPGLDQNHYLAGLFQVLCKLLDGVAADDVLAFGPAVDEIIDLRNRTIKAGHCKALAFHIEDEVFTHYCQAYQADIRICHFIIPFLICFL